MIKAREGGRFVVDPVRPAKVSRCVRFRDEDWFAAQDRADAEGLNVTAVLERALVAYANGKRSVTFPK